jgi:hypothetical protein
MPTEMLRSGVSFPALMKLLGHTSPDMTMPYLDAALTDPQREFHLARSQPRHLAPQPKAHLVSPRTGLESVIDSLLAAQHVMEPSPLLLRTTARLGGHPVSGPLERAQGALRRES